MAKKTSNSNARSATKTRRVDDFKIVEMDKLESGLAKLAVATSELVLGVASTKQRLDYTDEHHRKLEATKMIEHAELHERINAVQGDLSKKHEFLHDRINTVQTELTDRLGETTDKQTTKVTEHIDRATGKLSGEITGHVAKLEAADTLLAARVSTLEMWRWVIVGGAMVAGFIVTAVLLKVIFSMVESFGGWSKILLG